MKPIPYAQEVIDAEAAYKLIIEWMTYSGVEISPILYVKLDLALIRLHRLSLLHTYFGMLYSTTDDEIRSYRDLWNVLHSEAVLTMVQTAKKPHIW